MYSEEDPFNFSQEEDGVQRVEDPIEEQKDFGTWSLALLDIYDKTRTGPSMVYLNNAENLFRKKPRIPSAYRKQEAERMRKARRIHFELHEDHLRKSIEHFDRLSRCKKIHLGNYNTFKPSDVDEYSHISDEFLYQPENLIPAKEMRQEHNPLEPARRETGRSALTSPQEPFRLHEKRLIRLRRKSDSSKMAGGISKLELKVQYLPDEVKFVYNHEDHSHKKKEIRSIRELKAFKPQNSKNNLLEAGSMLRKATMIDRMHARATTMIFDRMKKSVEKSDKVDREMSEAQATPHRVTNQQDTSGGMTEKTYPAGDDTSKYSQQVIKLPAGHRESFLSVARSRPGSTSPIPSFNLTDEKITPGDALKNEVIESESEPLSPELKKDLKANRKVSSFQLDNNSKTSTPDKSPVEVKVHSPVSKKNSLKPYRIMSEKNKLPVISAVPIQSRLRQTLTPLKATTPYNFTQSQGEKSDENRFSLENSIERVENHTDMKIKKKRKIKRSQIYKRTIHENIKKIPEVYLNPLASVQSTTNKNVTVFLFDKKTFGNFKSFKYKPVGNPDKLIDTLNKPMTPLTRLSTPLNLNRTASPGKLKTPMKILEPIDRSVDSTGIRPKRPENAQNKRKKLFSSASEATMQTTKNIAVF